MQANSTRGSAQDPEPHLGQDWGSLRAQCQKERTLFCDPLFPAEPKALGPPAETTAASEKALPLEWLRPREICPKPFFLLEGASTTDICQGDLGDCWLLAAMSSLTLEPALFEQVVPTGQDFGTGYCGIFRFRFWQYGRWLEVVVDDRLPSRGKRLVYTRSSTRSEFWSALLEKAYAKLNGSYAALKAGKILEAMEDFTGGVGESYRSDPATPKLWLCVTSALAGNALLAGFIKVASPAEVGRVNECGLVLGHAYSILAMDKVSTQGGSVRLVRLRNPWGRQEYTGAWSDKATEWDSVEPQEQQRLKLKKSEDGEFWMSVEEFTNFFSTIEICSFNPEETEGADSTEGAPGTPTPPSWVLTTHDGRWIPGCSAGGCRKYKVSFWTNPQFRLSLRAGDEEGGSQGGGPGVAHRGGAATHCTVVLALMQKNRRGGPPASNGKGTPDFLYIGFAVYPVPEKVCAGCSEYWGHSSPPPPSSSSASSKNAASSIYITINRIRTSVADLHISFTRSKLKTSHSSAIVAIQTKLYTTYFHKQKDPLPSSFFVMARPVEETPGFSNAREVSVRARLPLGDYVVVPSTYEPDVEGDFFVRVYAKQENRSRKAEPLKCEFNGSIVFAAPAPTEPELDDAEFQKLAGRDGRISLSEFTRLVNSRLPARSALSIDACRSLVSFQPGKKKSLRKLNLEETHRFMLVVKKLQAVFLEFDRDGSGGMSTFELGQGLAQCGVKLRMAVYERAWTRFASADSSLSLSAFVSCVCRLQNLFSVYEVEKERTGEALPEFDEWVTAYIGL
ncbi:calpain-8-like [Petromyzon marinus]|uniref:calpain-8-like n=1 Tax=Petromyzon marinus TaxID=7757 RepID=UPI003F6F5DEE